MNKTDLEWLAPTSLIAAFVVGTETAVRYTDGRSELPPYISYSLVAALLSVAIAIPALLFFMRRRSLSMVREDLRPRMFQIAAFFIGFQVIAVTMAGMTGLKTMMTSVFPFWADPLFADADHLLFGTDPWRISHALFGPFTRFIDSGYVMWAPVKFCIVALVLSLPASRLKSQALLSQAVIWAVLGIAGAFAFSSAGPVFYEQVTGSDRFSPLLQNLAAEPDLRAPTTAKYLWIKFASGQFAFGSGISAMPSMHVAIAVWIGLVVTRLDWRLGVMGWAYALLIFVGSVHLAWHYALDGIVSGAGALLIWKMVGLWLAARRREDRVRSVARRPASSAAARTP